MALAMRKNSRRSRNVYIRPKEKSGFRLRRPSFSFLAPEFPGGFGAIWRYVSFRSIAAVLLGLAGTGLAIALVGAASLWLYGKAITSDFFTTRHIDVAGNVRLSRDMVLQYGGISEGDNSLAVSIADVERNLRDTPWVEEVSVKRLLPDRFVIKLKERMPSFWVRKDGALFYANEKGEIIAPVESRNFLSLPTLAIEAGAEDGIPYLARLLKDIQAGGLPIEPGSIASVTLSPSRGVEIHLGDREMRLCLAVDDWEGNISRLRIALGDLARRRELGEVREARAVDGHVWIIRNQGAGN